MSGLLQVGGLRDTVTPFDPHSDSGTGWTFDWADSGAFRGALGNALYTYRDYRGAFEGVQHRGMAQARSSDMITRLWEYLLLYCAHDLIFPFVYCIVLLHDH